MHLNNQEDDNFKNLLDEQLVLKKFFESTPMMMGVADVENDDIRHVSDNEAAAKFFGLSVAEMKGKLASQLGVSRKQIDNWLSHYLEAEKTVKPVCFEYYHSSGQCFSVTVSFIEKTDLGTSRFCYIVQDMSEKKLAQLEKKVKDLQIEKIAIAERSRQELQDFIMQAPVAMAILNGHQHQFTFANSMYEKFVGKKVIGKTLLEVFTEKEVSLYKPLLDDVYETGNPYVGKELPVKISDDKGNIPDRWINVGFNPYQATEGQISGIFLVIQDVTEQVQARKEVEKIADELKTEQGKLETIFQKSPAAMALWNGKDLIFEKANPAYHAFFPGRELLGKPFVKALPELIGQEFDKLLINVMETGEPIHGKEVVARHPKDPGGPAEDFYYDFSYIQITDSEGNPYGVYDHAIDVTERVLSRRSLEKAVASLKEERGMIDRFVATLSHDLRTPLTAAKMSAQIISRKAGDPDLVSKSANRIVDNMDRADRMIRDLLDVNRIKAGEKLPLDITECNLRKIISEVLEDLGGLHGDRFVFNPVEEITGHWSCLGIRRMIENLCNNAIKYGSSRSPVVVNYKKAKGFVDISVHNMGNPISRSDQDKLFEPFARSESALTSSEKGWGLGLALVKGLSEAHGGGISLSSNAEEGTTFTINLPLRKD
jgi:PAS domain S-box-containing protein